MKIQITWDEFIKLALDELKIKTPMDVDVNSVEFLNIDERGTVSENYTLPDVIELEILKPKL